MLKRIPNNLASDFSACKIFVGGLSWNTTKEMLFNEFSKYGEIIDSIVMRNPETGNSRGFGFVTYKTNTSAESAVASGNHNIDGKDVDVKLCNPRGQQQTQQRFPKIKNDNCKVFVGGLPHGVTDDEIKQFFSRYGLVKEFKMMFDEKKQRPRGFGFITFELEDSANQVLQEHYFQFNGKQIEVKPQVHNNKQNFPNGDQFGMNQNGSMPGYQSNGMMVGFNGVGQQYYQTPQVAQYSNPSQPNWNYNYYGGQQQAGYYPPDAPEAGNFYNQPAKNDGEKMHGYQQYKNHKNDNDINRNERRNYNSNNNGNYQPNENRHQKNQYYNGNHRGNYGNQMESSNYQQGNFEENSYATNGANSNSPTNGRQSSSYHPYRR